MRNLAHRLSRPLLLLSAAWLTVAPARAAAASLALARTWSGEAVGDQFGIAIAPAGDLDRDGFPDLLVGANVNDDAAASGGRAYVYAGGGSLPTGWSLVYSGTVPRGYAGQALAGGRDLDGDGFPDWVVGAPGPGTTGDYPGQVFVFRGGPGADAVPDLVLTGRVPGGQFGLAVCLPGDLDGDGGQDLVVGAPRAGGGAVYVYRGGAAVLDSVPDAVLHAGPEDQRLGFRLVGLPDRDGDGRDELLIGVPLSSRTSAWAGAVLLLNGSADLDTIPDAVWTGATAGEEFGYALAAGDADGDGVPDLWVGAPFANSGGLTDAGRVDLFPGLAPAAALSFTGDETESHAGLAVAAGFDWDGDGADDLAVGIPEADAGGIDAGRVAVLFGGAALDAVADTVITGDQPGLHLGTALAAGGDLAGNGRGTLCAGGYNTVNSGAVWVFASGDPVVVAAPDRPAAAALSAPWPNPANPSVSCRLRLPAAGAWRLTVHDLAGRLVAVLHDGPLAAGAHTVRWDGRTRGGTAAPAGTYLLRAAGSGGVTARRFQLVR